MTAFMSFLNGLVSILQTYPVLIASVKGVIDALHSGEDVTPAMKHAEVAAAEHFLGIE